MNELYKVRDVCSRERPGRKQWLAIVELDSRFVQWPSRRFYGRTRDGALAKAQQWIDRKNRRIWHSETTADSEPWPEVGGHYPSRITLDPKAIRVPKGPAPGAARNGGTS